MNISFYYNDGLTFKQREIGKPNKMYYMKRKVLRFIRDYCNDRFSK